MAESKKKSTKKVTPKKEVSSKSKKKKKSKKIDSTVILTIIFCLLLGLVVALSVVVIKNKLDHKDDIKANIVVPIVNKEDEAPFSVNLRALNESNEYIFKIANYSGMKINKEKLNYYIDVLNETDTKVSLSKYGSKENLLNGDTATTIECGSVPTDKKSDDYYVIRIDKAGTLGKDDLVKVKVRAVK